MKNTIVLIVLLFTVLADNCQKDYLNESNKKNLKNE